MEGSPRVSQQKKELEYILGELIPQFEERLQAWNKEYTQERDLGVKGEFVGLYRKVRKLKTIIWDGESDAEWREDTRTMLLEVIGHAFLAISDLDEQERKPTEVNIQLSYGEQPIRGGLASKKALEAKLREGMRNAPGQP
jgi:hypothetical protein